jgi:hypothetical protein
VVIASGGGVAVLAAAADEITASSASTIVAAHSGGCLTVAGAAEPITRRSCTPGAASRQTFRFAPAGGAYTIAPLDAGGCLGVRADVRATGSLHLATTCTGGPEQRFSVTEVDRGVYTIKNEQTGRCVDDSPKSTAAATPVVVRPCRNGLSQRWKLAAAVSGAEPSTGQPPSPSAPTTSTPTASTTATGTASPSATATPSAPPAAECARQPGASPAANVTEVNVGVPVIGYGREGDTEPLPMAIAATPSGGSWLAWLGTDTRVYLGRLDCDDRLVGTPTSFEGIDLQDVQADSNGGVVLLTRRGTCGDGPLCGGSSSPCNTMHMIRFDNSGQQVWERQVTNLSGSLEGYDNGARFIWWYQHHGRLASDGKNYAAYFGVAITVNNGSCVDIHEGDRMQVVDADGSLVPGHRDSFEVGCSHSWTSRIVWDPRTSRYVMVCATDNACRIAQPHPYRTVAAGTCDGTLFGGDLVLASTAGYWTAWSQGGQVRLEHFTTGQSDTTVTTSATSSHPHLVSYGTGRMLLTWEVGSAMAAQVYDAGSAVPVGAQFTINVRDHNYQAFKPYADGSVAYPAAGSNSTSIRIARVMPLGG